MVVGFKPVVEHVDPAVACTKVHHRYFDVAAPGGAPGAFGCGHRTDQQGVVGGIDEGAFILEPAPCPVVVDAHLAAILLD
jgi:hypothetical protein